MQHGWCSSDGLPHITREMEYALHDNSATVPLLNAEEEVSSITPNGFRAKLANC